MNTQNETPAAHWGRVNPLEIDALIKRNAELVQALENMVEKVRLSAVYGHATANFGPVYESACEALAKGEVRP